MRGRTVTRIAAWSAPGALATFVLAACGGGGSGASCGAVEGCGGELEGTWKVSALCAEVSNAMAVPGGTSLPRECQSALERAFASATVTPVDARIQFTSDGRYVQSGTMRMSTRYVFTEACLRAAAGGAAPSTGNIAETVCGAFGSGVMDAFDQVDCGVSAGSCRCSVSGLFPFDETGPYRTSGSQVYFDGSSEGGDYCVEDDSATLAATASGLTGGMVLARTSSGAAGSSASAGRSGSGGSQSGTVTSGRGGLPIAGQSAGSSGGEAGTGTGSGGMSGTGVIVDPDAGVPPLDGDELSAGTSRLIDVFVAAPGVYVVLEDAVVLFDRDGSEVSRVAAPRPLSAAAFDGTTLVVADSAQLSSYDLDLAPITSGNLIEPCASAVMVSGSRFVCGPANDWDRIFYTYDATSGDMLASSSPYTYNGIPMRRIPGSDEFVTVTTNLSPSDYHLYSVLGTGEASYVNESPYHGDFAINGVYAWNAVPATHLVTHTGLLLQIHADGCAAGGAATGTQGCFVQDGMLGTSSGSQVFVAMDTDESGRLHAIVAATASFGSECADACDLQRIDVAGQTVEAQRVTRFGAGRFVALRYDAVSGSAVAGYDLPGSGFSSDPYPGHRVALFAED